MSTLKTLESLGRTVDVSPIILTQLTAKLPRHKQEQWGSLVYELQRKDPPRDADNKDFYDFLERITGTEDVLSFRSDVQQPAREERKTRATVLATSSLSPSDGSTNRECTICQGKHRIGECKKFQNLPVESRFGAVKERKLCFRCLKPNHLSRECKSKKVCGTENCRSKHHFLLHNAPRLEARAETGSLDAPNPPVQSQDSAILTTTEVVRSPPSTLPTVPVWIIGPSGKRVEVNALLDAGSTVSLIDQRLCHELQMKLKTTPTRFRTFHGNDPHIPMAKVSFLICSKDGRVKKNQQLLVLPRDKDRKSYHRRREIERLATSAWCSSTKD